MRTIKSERLKKLEAELHDLEHWYKLGLVPKNDEQKHKDEIAAIREKVKDEKERLQLLKETGDSEDFVAPKRNQPRAGYSEMPTIPDIDMAESAGGFETEIETDEGPGFTEERTVHTETEGQKTESEETHVEVEEESYFSDKNRWKRGGIIDPEANEW